MLSLRLALAGSLIAALPSQSPQPSLASTDSWSLRPVERPAVPTVDNPDWVQNPIDAFVLHRLEAAGLQPAPPAQRRQLARRAFYDLTGLAPTPAQMTAFLDDTRPGAFGRLVDRLLASPHYGEKWARHWLDLVRYAETNGYERDSDKRFIWRYRDYVIDAFNDDKPYDQFVREQIAGDELDQVTHESIIATGYQRLMIWDDEPGMGRLQARYDVLNDLVATTGEAFLGMTLGCARCHDHKKDPIPQKDYYRFMAFFHGVTDMSRDRIFTDIMTAPEREEYDRRVAEKERDEAAVLAEISTFETAFEAKLRAADGRAPAASDLADVRYRFYRDTWTRLPDFDALRPEASGTLANNRIDLAPATRRDAIGLVFEARLVVPADGEYRFSLATHGGARLTVGGTVVIDHDGDNRRHQTVTGTHPLIAGVVDLRVDYFNRRGEPRLSLSWAPAERPPWRYTVSAPRADTWAEPGFDDAGWQLGSGGFGSPGTPGAEIGTEWTSSAIWLRREFEWNGDPADLQLVAHHDERVEVYLNGVLAAQADGYRTGYGILPLSDDARDTLRRGRNTIAVHCRNQVGGQYVHVVPTPRTIAASTLADAAFGRRILSADDAAQRRAGIAQRIAERGAELLTDTEREHYRSLQERHREVRRRRIPRKQAAAVQERGGKVAQLHVHRRGMAAAKGDAVEPAFPSCLHPPAADLPEPAADAASSGRRRVLADWIAAPANPRTARVLVNRLWQHLFGNGIVSTANDFGALGSGATHPELLDWLASEFVARGWSIKAMHRLILSSNAYRMSARSHPGSTSRALERDPTNELRWRFDLRRLTAEEMRDSILALTGKLNLQIGGPSVFSRMPAAALATSSRPKEVWGTSPEPQANRRSIYVKVKRSLLTPILANFDFADTDTSCPQRFTTTLPTQALGMLNGEFANHHAAEFARRLRREASDEDGRIRLALQLATCREPRADEIADHRNFLADLRAGGASEEQALHNFCLMVFSLAEFAYVE